MKEQFHKHLSITNKEPDTSQLVENVLTNTKPVLVLKFVKKEEDWNPSHNS